MPYKGTCSETKASYIELDRIARTHYYLLEAGVADSLAVRHTSPERWPVAYGGTSPICPGTGERHQSTITHVSALNARRLQGPLVPL